MLQSTWQSFTRPYYVGTSYSCSSDIMWISSLHEKWETVFSSLSFVYLMQHENGNEKISSS